MGELKIIFFATFIAYSAIFRRLFSIFAPKIHGSMKLNRIKAVLVEQDKSQKWLAEQLGKSFSTTNAYCCNRQQPNLDTLYRIAQLLSVELKELIVDNTKNEEV